MEVKHVALTIVDISGYTRFLEWNKTSLLHAETIITELLEAVIDQAEFPLKLNKLEGDAALMFAVIPAADDQRAAAAQDITRQVQRFHQAFQAKQQEMVAGAQCPCDACQNLSMLRLKAFLHLGEVVIKQVRQFEELAGSEVILIHRLLKNHIPAREYLAMTETFYRAGGGIPDQEVEQHEEGYSDIGSVRLFLYYPGGKAQAMQSIEAQSQPSGPRLSNWMETTWHRLFKRKKTFHNLPY
ncbi:MAG: DUF2652 domain-containing protein [Chloroflexota bacterium]